VKLSVVERDDTLEDLAHEDTAVIVSAPRPPRAETATSWPPPPPKPWTTSRRRAGTFGVAEELPTFGVRFR
jgi:hypothetical protein